MQEIMIAIVLGIAVGYSDLLNYNVKKWLSRFSTVSLFIMLLCLGAKIGCDAELLGKLDQLGGKSLVINPSATVKGGKKSILTKL